MKRTRKGFTLVELLIVVAILGTLSAAMMMASRDATPKAKARQIAADLKTIAVAVSLYCSDSADIEPTATYFKAHSDDYIFGTKLTNYTISGDDTGGKWYALYNPGVSGDVKAQMNKISSDVGILYKTEASAADKPYMRVK